MSHLENLSNRIARNVEPLDKVMASLESLMLALIVRLASIGASIPNAVMVARSAAQTFNLEWGWCLAIAISLELISHALVEHWQSAKHWNETKRQSDSAMNVKLALTLVILFYVLDFVMVGALCYQTFTTTQNPQIFIALSYPLVGVFTSIVTSERAHLFRLRTSVQIERQDRAQKRTQNRTQSRTRTQKSEQRTTFKTAAPNTERVQIISGIEHARAARAQKREQRIGQMLNIFEQNSRTPITDVAEQLEMSRTTVYSYIDELEQQGIVKKNGQGIEVLARG